MTNDRAAQMAKNIDMMKELLDPLNPSISDIKYKRLTQYIYNEYGIVLSESKKALVVNRVFKRLLALDIDTIDEYLDFVFSDKGQLEKEQLGELLSTNKTFFFREEEHFKFLKSKVEKRYKNKNFKIWSAGCSSGEEAYTMALIFDELYQHIKFDYHIWATDISTKSLRIGQEGEFHENQFWTTPHYYKGRYFKKVEKPIGVYYQIDKSMGRKIHFDRFNLINDTVQYGMKFDFIFCRNVLIYFDNATKVKVVKKLLSHLSPGGFLIVGLTEGFIGNELGLKSVKPSVFQAHE